PPASWDNARLPDADAGLGAVAQKGGATGQPRVLAALGGAGGSAGQRNAGRGADPRAGGGGIKAFSPARRLMTKSARSDRRKPMPDQIERTLRSLRGQLPGRV